MNSSFWRRDGRLWVQGLLLAALRLVQNRTGFDPDTGLARHGAAGLAGTVLVAGILLSAAAELVQARRLPKESAAYGDQFAPPERELPAAVTGCMLLAAGGALLLLRSMTAHSLVNIAAGVLAIAGGAGLLLLLRQARAEEEVTVLPSLPAALFGVLFVLAVYLPTDCDPVLARYYLPVLASAMAAYAFGVLSGFLQQESSPRSFSFTTGLAVPLCVAAMADDLGAPMRLLFAGCAVVLTVFRLLCRDQALPAAEKQEDAPAERAAELPEEA